MTPPPGGDGDGAAMAATLRSTLVAKSDFVGLDQVAHLATGGEAPFLTSHWERLACFAQDKSGGMAGRERILAVADAARQKLATLLGCDARDIGFPHNVAQGMNLVVDGLALAPGDNVVLHQWEFPSVLYPWLQQRRRGVEVRLVPSQGWSAPLERVQAALDGHTRAVILSHVSYYTGERQDLAAYSALAHDVGAALIVDASHSLGAVPVYAPHADFLFACCYKWLLGTHGVAVGYWNRVRQPDWRPPAVGWWSVEAQRPQDQGGGYTQVSDGRVFELGNPTFIGLHLLDNAVAYLARTGEERIAERVLGLSGELRLQLAALGVRLLTPEPVAQRAGNVAFAVEDERRWRQELERRGVLGWTGEQRVRFSTHFYNDLSDIERAVAAVAEVLALRHD